MMRGTRSLICSKAFALGILCAYSSVAVVLLVAKSTTYCDGTRNVRMRETDGGASVFMTVSDERDAGGGDGGGGDSKVLATSKMKSEALFADNFEEVNSLEEIEDIANRSEYSPEHSWSENNAQGNGLMREVPLDELDLSKQTDVADEMSLAATTKTKTNLTKVQGEIDPSNLEVMGNKGNASTVSLQTPVMVETTVMTTAIVAAQTPEKDGATKAPVLVVDDSVVEPTLPLGMRSKQPVTLEMPYGSNTRCSKKSQHGLDCRRRVPKVIGIGMERCGTTALSFFLRMHPDIVHAKPKDVYYWNHHPDRSLDWYRNRMPISSKYQVTMEYTPSYILSHEVPHLIKEVVPDMKFIVMIRDPIERAMSHYLYMRHTKRPEYLTYIAPQPGAPAKAYQGASFEATVLTKTGDIFKDNAVIENAIYESHLRRWFDIFPRKQFLIIDEGLFSKDPVSILQQVEDFIGISKFFTNYHVYFDRDRGVFCRRVPTKYCSKRSIKNVHPPIPQYAIKKLREFYRPYNVRLEKLLNRTFPWT
ncbi:uncharacterized protein LOC129278760 [Lytechinus pictus]|uniref:uncharacterized protein LOC129278760 n=1 Tax=Lytechinus pictus TaxID=7653 RepID=UPI0030B9F4D1